METTWADLHEAAMKVLKPREVSSMIEAGGVAAAVESSSGEIYVGVCVDTACTLGVCAEREAGEQAGEEQAERVQGAECVQCFDHAGFSPAADYRHDGLSRPPADGISVPACAGTGCDFPAAAAGWSVHAASAGQ